MKGKVMILSRRKKKYATVRAYRRKGYWRHGYTRKNGVHVKRAYVPPARVKEHKTRIWRLNRNQKPVNPHPGRKKRRR